MVRLTDFLVGSATLRITRNKDMSDIHIFTTRFYRKLAKKGPEAVAAWTHQRENGSINVFKKRLIFIPSKFFLRGFTL